MHYRNGREAKNGDKIVGGSPLGTSQTLQNLYSGITDHVHITTRDRYGDIVNPADWLKHYQNKKTHYDR